MALGGGVSVALDNAVVAVSNNNFFSFRVAQLRHRQRTRAFTLWWVYFLR